MNVAIQDLENTLRSDYGIEIYGVVDNLIREVYLRGHQDGQALQQKQNELFQEEDYER